MLRALSLLTLLAVSSAAQNPATPVFPARVATDADLLVGSNLFSTSLSQSIGAGDMLIPVASVLGFTAPGTITIGKEIIEVCGTSGSAFTVCAGGRGFDGTTAAAAMWGAGVKGLIVARHHNQPAAEIEAIENALGPNMLTFETAINQIPLSTYNFSQTPRVSLTAGIPNAIPMSPCPLGVNGSDANHFVYFSGGSGTPESALMVSGGTCLPGASSGTIVVIPANAHSGLYTVASATAGIQEWALAHPTGGTLNLLPGAYTLHASVTYGPHHCFRGASRTATVITNTNDSVYAFSYLSPVGTVQNVVEFSTRFEEFTLNSKYGIQANSAASGSMQFQALLVGGPYISHVLFNGKYGVSIIDPNALTTVTPATGELEAYGIAVFAAKAFEMHVAQSEFNNNGIGIDVIGCDIGQLDQNRYYSNGRNVQAAFYSDGLPDASGALGSSLKISNSDIIAVQRVGGISLTANQFTVITKNFFEGFPFTGAATNVGEYIAASNDFGTQILANRIDSFQTTNPAVSLDSRFGTLIEENVVNPNPPNPSVFCGTTHYDGANFPMLYKFSGNAPELVQCDSPLALVGKLNPYLFRYNNIPGQFFGNATATFPFVVSPVTGRWVIKTTNTPNFSFKMPLVRGSDRSFVVKVTARRVTNSGFLTISLIEGGVTTTLWAAAPSTGFTSTTNVQTLNFPITLPPAPDTALGYLQFDLPNDQVEYESIELIPQLNGPFPYQGSLGGGAVGVGTSIASASTITPPGPYFYITGTNTINTINIPAGFAGGSVCAIPVAVFSTTTAGNIGKASTAVPNQTLCWFLDPYGPKWYPTY